MWREFSSFLCNSVSFIKYKKTTKNSWRKQEFFRSQERVIQLLYTRFVC